MPDDSTPGAPVTPTAADADPLDAAREEARLHSEGSQLPTERGLGAGAGEIGVTTVTAPAQPEGGDVPANPSFGEPPRHDEGRPEFRTSQLESGDESGQSDDPPQHAGAHR